jgi:hypothetical protein
LCLEKCYHLWICTEDGQRRLNAWPKHNFVPECFLDRIFLPRIPRIPSILPMPWQKRPQYPKNNAKLNGRSYIISQIDKDFMNPLFKMKKKVKKKTALVWDCCNVVLFWMDVKLSSKCRSVDSFKYSQITHEHDREAIIILLRDMGTIPSLYFW